MPYTIPIHDIQNVETILQPLTKLFSDIKYQNSALLFLIKEMSNIISSIMPTLVAKKNMPQGLTKCQEMDKTVKVINGLLDAHDIQKYVETLKTWAQGLDVTQDPHYQEIIALVGSDTDLTWLRDLIQKTGNTNLFTTYQNIIKLLSNYKVDNLNDLVNKFRLLDPNPNKHTQNLLNVLQVRQLAQLLDANTGVEICSKVQELIEDRDNLLATVKQQREELEDSAALKKVLGHNDLKIAAQQLSSVKKHLQDKGVADVFTYDGQSVYSIMQELENYKNVETNSKGIVIFMFFTIILLLSAVSIHLALKLRKASIEYQDKLMSIRAQNRKITQ